MKELKFERIDLADDNEVVAVFRVTKLANDEFVSYRKNQFKDLPMTKEIVEAFTYLNNFEANLLNGLS